MMKKLLLVTGFFLITFFTSIAQNTFPNTGNVGIGTTTPSSKLDIHGANFNTTNLILSANYVDKYRWRVKTIDRGNAIDLDFTASDSNDSEETILKLSRSNSTRPEFQLYNNAIVVNNGNVGIGNSNPSTKLHIVQNNDPGIDKGLLISEEGNEVQILLHLANNTAGQYGYFNLGGNTILRGNGQVSHFDGRLAIGTTNPGSWKLAVNGNIRAKEIKVETGWSDFVFENDYNLPTLEEVEQHIKEKGHLKNIPSAEEVAQNGIFLGEMDSKLLQKIEELMLYTIQQQKEIEELKETNRTLSEENKKYYYLEERLRNLEEELKR